IPIDHWQEVYEQFITELLKKINLQRITLGGICSYKTAQSLMNQKISPNNSIQRNLSRHPSEDGRMRYSPEMRIKIYSALIAAIRSQKPDLTISLCMENMDVVKAVNLLCNLGKCVCPL
ncbi:MAG: hypothetical protein AB1656_12910, partial [Candidatus Omnitrophota bacterium]